MRGKITKRLLANIDWDALRAEITRSIGIQVNSLDISATKDGRLVMESEELIEHAGIMKAVLTSLKVDNFGGEYLKDKRVLWVPVHFSWTHTVGGTNGHGLFDANWSFRTKEWTFHRRRGT